MIRFIGKFAISSIFDWFVQCLAAPPGAVGARKFAGLCQRITTDWVPLMEPSLASHERLDRQFFQVVKASWLPSQSIPIFQFVCSDLVIIIIIFVVVP